MLGFTFASAQMRALRQARQGLIVLAAVIVLFYMYARSITDEDQVLGHESPIAVTPPALLLEDGVQEVCHCHDIADEHDDGSECASEVC